MTVSQQKKALRLKMRKLSASLSRKDMNHQSERVFSRIESLDCFRSAKTVAIFWAMSDELPTQKFVEQWASEKRVLLPVTDCEGMVFKQYVPGDELAEGNLRILEPAGGTSIPHSEIDLMIVPGIAFDHKGHRLGRGKGYYDKFLSDCQAYKIGVCMDHQLVDSVPHDGQDKAVDIVVYPSDKE